MRVASEITDQGVFWLYDKPEEQLPGTIVISDGGNIRLKVTHFFDPQAAPDHREETFKEVQQKPPLILGQTHNLGPISVSDNLHVRRSVQIANPTQSIVDEYESHRAYLGAHVEEAEPEFSKVSFGIERADDWVASDFLRTRNRESLNRRTLEWEDKLTEIELPSGITLRVISQFLEQLAIYNPRYSLSHVVRFSLSSRTPIALSEFTSAAHSITNFLCFALGTTTTLVDVRGIQKVDGGEQEVRFFYPSRPFTERSMNFQRQKVLLPYSEISSEIPNIVRKWCSMHTEFPEVFGMFAYVQAEKVLPLETRYMLVVSSLEALAKRCIVRSGRRAPLRQLLRKASGKVGKFDDELRANEEVIVKCLVAFRNAIAHGDQIADHSEMSPLWLIYLRLRVLHQLSLMTTIGIPEASIPSLHSNSEYRKLVDMYPADYEALSNLASRM